MFYRSRAASAVRGPDLPYQARLPGRSGHASAACVARKRPNPT